MFPQNMSKSFEEMIEKGTKGFIIIFAAMSLAGLIGLFLMIRSEKSRAQQTETRVAIVLKVLIYYFLSMLFMSAVFVFQSASLVHFDGSLSIDKKHIKALMLAGSVVGYIFLLVGSVKAARAKGRNESVPLKAKIQLCLGAVLFAASLTVSAIFILR